MVFAIIVGFLFLFFVVLTATKDNRKNLYEPTPKEPNNLLQGQIDAGSLICGHPRIERIIDSTALRVLADRIEIYEVPKKGNPTKLEASITLDSITDVAVSDKSQLFLNSHPIALFFLGFAGIGIKHKVIIEKAILVIKFNSEKICNSVVFEFSGDYAIFRANYARNNILRKL